MSVYNSEEFIGEAIKSILNQTYKNFEFIIINDGSTDNSLKIVKKYLKKDKRIVLIDCKANLGLTKSLNKGLKIARGDYIARQDADDVSLPERFEIQYDYLKNNKDVFLIGTGAIKINPDGSIIGVHKAIINSEELKKALEKSNVIYHPTIMFKNENYLYREKFRYSQDYDFYLLLLSKGKILANIQENLVKYRVDPKSISSSKRAQQYAFEKYAAEFYRERKRVGKDMYNSFKPKEILNSDEENSTDKFFLKYEIIINFKHNDFKKSRDFCTRYFKNHGVINKFTVFYLLSFSNRKFIDFLRKVF